ncbi:rhodanese-like domain-containing protein [Desmospora profundinema]|uniref:Rhodanese-related sulfurtransferase n=1 Tax=Desmospora profundinema TaxID=1571184 RepID=A0ABU1IID9_9BACL|nr:rhodanese-like domain-containing protein [Desmospora profundinema]MDR6224537.1 rhodanese-related sulfurtransferase [Desmospora profundinema]
MADVSEITAQVFADKVRGGKLSDSLLLDVREPMEWKAYHLPGAVLIPLGDLPERYEELNPDRELYVFCAHGIRSVHAVRFLAAQNRWNIVHVNGGLAEVALYLEEKDLPPGPDVT